MVRKLLTLSGHALFESFVGTMQNMTTCLAAGTAAGDPIAALLVGSSRAMEEVRRQVAQVGPSDASVIVMGPSGSGKEVVARAIHAASPRASSAHVSVNCGAIPRDLIESELFGHEKGSFTGAHAQHRGRFEEADGGTLFLDEIGDMPHDMQVKLLRVLEDRRVTRVGGRGAISVDARIVSATHRCLDSAIDDKSFREDLYYRLAVFPIDLPGLAERSEDVPELVHHFLKAPAARRSGVLFNSRALDRLIAHDWPGNCRELDNVLQRALLLRAGERLEASDLIIDALPADATAPAVPANLSDIARAAEARTIRAALAATGGHRLRAAEQLGISERTLRYRLAEMREAAAA
jgi:sigma-54 specific flagellar transcriptional regulator A